MMEFLEDTEKRILLSAISREKKVCEQVDKESCREPYETRLTDICKSLEYKFMYDRLFKKIYEQGRADKYQEIASEYMLLTEKQVAEIRAESAKDFAEWLSNTEYVTSQGHFILPLRGTYSVDELLDMWEEEQKE